MEEFRGLTAEMYQTIVAIVDDWLREVRVTREGLRAPGGSDNPTSGGPDAH